MSLHCLGLMVAELAEGFIYMALDVSESATQTFLDTIRLDGSDGYRALWKMRDRSTEFFPVTDVARMTIRAFNLRNETDVYYSIGVLSETPEGGRGKKKDVVAIPGLWLDLDANNNPACAKEGFPATVEEVRDILKRFEPAPSIVIYSGGGLQAIWLFDQLWRFDNDEDREQAEQLLNKWRVLFNLKAKPYQFDKVADVSRVLRLPGTRNHKFASPVNAGVLKIGPERYTVDALQRYVSGVVIPTKAKTYSDTRIRREGEGRDNRLWSFAGLIRDAVDTEDEMYALLDAFNQHCFDDPLGDDIVRDKAERIMRYEPRAVTPSVESYSWRAR